MRKSVNEGLLATPRRRPAGRALVGAHPAVSAPPGVDIEVRHLGSDRPVEVDLWDWPGDEPFDNRFGDPHEPHPPGKVLLSGAHFTEPPAPQTVTNARRAELDAIADGGAVAGPLDIFEAVV